MEDDTKRVQSALCTRMRIVFYAIRHGPKTSGYHMKVIVVSTVSGCDVTNVQLHNTGSTSTPPRVARLCQIREASLVALRKISKICACSHVSIVRLVQSIRYSYPEISTVIRRHCTICRVNSSRSAQYPCQALISVCGISRVPVLSFQCHLHSHRS